MNLKYTENVNSMEVDEAGTGSWDGYPNLINHLVPEKNGRVINQLEIQLIMFLTFVLFRFIKNK